MENICSVVCYLVSESQYRCIQFIEFTSCRFFFSVYRILNQPENGKLELIEKEWLRCHPIKYELNTNIDDIILQLVRMFF